MRLTEAVAQAGWRARLDLRFARRGQATILAARRHVGPLALQKPLYPEGEGVCHAIVLHPPAGIAGGDELALNVELEPGARALLTTPGAGKWYRSDGREAGSRLSFVVGEGAVLEWLPQESIIFDGALARMGTEVVLAPGAVFVGWDILCLGRTAAGERFGRGRLRLDTRIVRDGRPLWRERGLLEGGSPWLQAPAGFGGCPVSGTMLVAGPAPSPELLAACRVVESSSDARWGVTGLPRLLVARWLGHSGEAARDYFVRLWQRLRPALLGRAAQPPRIWAT
ncbi:MAG: urease accessory protein UreD [Pseudomonadota bacterium]|jgi:urease accessory protein